MQHLWLSDCNSLVTHLHNVNDTRLENVRVSIDIATLRQRLWTDPITGEPESDFSISSDGRLRRPDEFTGAWTPDSSE